MRHRNKGLENFSAESTEVLLDWRLSRASRICDEITTRRCAHPSDFNHLPNGDCSALKSVQDKSVIERYTDQDRAFLVDALQQEVRETQFCVLQHIANFEWGETAPAEGFSNMEAS